jgi:glycosyltransferase involved in cell wall biosynthesis
VAFTVAVGEAGFLVDTLGELGIPVRFLPVLQREVSPAEDARAVASLRRIIRAERPHLVHTHSTKAGLLGRLAARLEGVPAIHTAHAWSFSDGIAWRRKAFAIPLEALAGRWTARFVAVSEADREVAERFRVARPGQVAVVHNGVQDVEPRADPGAGEPPVLTMIARMAAPKDHLLLLRALSRVNRPFHARFVGDGPDRATIEAERRVLGLEERVELLGVRRDIPELLATSQLAVLASRQEGFPLTVLEAMRAGLPVVASRVGGIAEAVEHGRNGLLVRSGDEPGLAAALDQLLGDPVARRRMGEAGRRDYEARFTDRRMVAGVGAVYDELAHQHGWPVPGPAVEGHAS